MRALWFRIPFAPACPFQKRRHTRCGAEIGPRRSPGRRKLAADRTHAASRTRGHARRTHCSGSRLPRSNADSSRPSCVEMVQPTHHRKLDHLTTSGRLYRSRFRGVLVEGQMNAARVVVVRHVPTQQPSKVSPVHHDRMIHEFPPQRADHAFDVGRLPGWTKLLGPTGGRSGGGRTLNQSPPLHKRLYSCRRLTFW